MSNETEFVQGLYFNLPHQNAPDYIKGKLSIQKEKLLQWLQQKQPNDKGYINAVIKISQQGRPYIAVDNWQPGQQQQTQQPQQQQQAPSQQQSEHDDNRFDGGDDIPF